MLAHHTHELIPGVAYWLESGKRPARRLSPLFVGLGDAIYSRGDERAPTSRAESQELALPRLPGCGAEMEACARAWRGSSVLLRGGDATREKLAEALLQRPAAVHLATHYLESARWRIQAGLVVLSGCHSAAGAPLPGEGALGLRGPG